MADTKPFKLTLDEANKITDNSILQLQTSRNNKRERLRMIRESEDLYLGVQKKSLRNPFNEQFPYMAGFIDHLLSNIDEPPKAEYTAVHLEDYKLAQKYTALYTKESTSTMPHASWAKKDRWVKKFASFSGLGTYLFYTESYPTYRNCLEAVDYLDFHFEPGGGGDLEGHLFCGQEPIFKTKEELEDGATEGYYDAEQVKKLVAGTSATDYKQNANVAEDKFNRHRAFGLDPISNNYTGQQLFRLVQWFTTYKGRRFYVLFDEQSRTWVRCKLWQEICSSNLWPYVCWQTHEDASSLMLKAPADDARSIARIMNRLLNQELYSREKINMGQRLYDPEMIEDVEALTDYRPDGLIPVNTMKGTRQLQRALQRVETGTLSGTLDLVGFLNNFAGEKLSASPSSMGNADDDKKVGVFFGEIKEQQKRFGLYNISYKEAHTQIALRLFLNGRDHIKQDVSVKLMGVAGYEVEAITPEEAADEDVEFDIKITGGSDEMMKEASENERKAAAMPLLTTTNPRWKDDEILRLYGFSADERKDAFNPLPAATMDLLSEAAQAVKAICAGRKAPLNRGANLAYMQYVIDQATDLDVSLQIQGKLYDFASAHATIVAENEARNALSIMREKGLAPAAAEAAPAAPAPVPNSSLFPAAEAAPANPVAA